MIRFFLLNNTDDSLAPDYVNTPAVRVVIHVIGVASAGQGGDDVACLRAENDEPGWTPGSDEQPVISFVQRHREVESIPVQLPFGNRTRLSINRQGDVSAVGIVHEDLGSGRLQLK